MRKSYSECCDACIFCKHGCIISDDIKNSANPISNSEPYFVKQLNWIYKDAKTNLPLIKLPHQGLADRVHDTVIPSGFWSHVGKMLLLKIHFRKFQHLDLNFINRGVQISFVAVLRNHRSHGSSARYENINAI